MPRQESELARNVRFFDNLSSAANAAERFCILGCRGCRNPYGLTTLTGLPDRNAATLDTVQSMIRWRLSLAAQEM